MSIGKNEMDKLEELVRENERLKLELSTKTGRLV